MFDKKYEKQVALLLQTLTFISDTTCFALKGGTAINMFVRDMPRLSVDIDLTYTPFSSREIALSEIEEALLLIKNKVTSTFKNATVLEKRTVYDKNLIKLFVVLDGTQITIEPNTVLRGHLNPIETKDLVKAAEDIFQFSVLNIPILSTAELYAGKICAALDRQHPRDLFDIKQLYENEGLTESIRQAFVVYLASGSRPIHEVLSPNRLDQTDAFASEFMGMTTTSVSYSELENAREQLITDINEQLTEGERKFLLSVKQGSPEYRLLPFNNLELLPALNWKIANIQKMPTSKHSQMLDKLKKTLQL